MYEVLSRAICSNSVLPLNRICPTNIPCATLFSLDSRGLFEDNTVDRCVGSEIGVTDETAPLVRISYTSHLLTNEHDYNTRDIISISLGAHLFFAGAIYLIGEIPLRSRLSVVTARNEIVIRPKPKIAP